MEPAVPSAARIVSITDLEIGWLTVDEITENMNPAYAIRVTDALAGSIAARAHDGTDLATA